MAVHGQDSGSQNICEIGEDHLIVDKELLGQVLLCPGEFHLGQTQGLLDLSRKLTHLVTLSGLIRVSCEKEGGDREGIEQVLFCDREWFCKQQCHAATAQTEERVRDTTPAEVTRQKVTQFPYVAPGLPPPRNSNVNPSLQRCRCLVFPGVLTPLPAEMLCMPKKLSTTWHCKHTPFARLEAALLALPLLFTALLQGRSDGVDVWGKVTSEPDAPRF